MPKDDIGKTGYTFNKDQLQEQRDLFKDINNQILDMQSGAGEYNKSLIKQNANLAAMLEEKRKIAGTDIGGEDYQDVVKAVKDISRGQLTIDDLLKKQATARARGKKDVVATYGTELKRLKVEDLKNQAMGAADGLTGGMASKTKETLGFAKQMGPKFLMAGAAIGGVAFIVGGLIKSFKFASEMIDTLGGSFGVIGTQASNFRDSMMKASIDVIALGKGTDDVVSVVSTLSSEFGVGLQAATNISEQILDTAVATGMATGEAAKLFGTFMSIGDLTADQSERLIENTYQLAAQNKVNPAAVMQDIAGSALLIAEFGANNLDSITKAAVQARKLRLNLDDVSTISNSLLDFQSSLNAEVEASIMIGRRLNFNKARQLALEGDLSGVMDEVLKQVGSEAELNKLNVLERRALSKSLGLNVTQFTKLIREQDKSVVKQKSFVDLMGKDGMSALTSVINKVKALGAQVMLRLGKPLANLMDKIEDKFFTEENMQKIENAMMKIADVVIMIGKGIGTIFSYFYSIATKGFFSTILGGADDMFGGLTDPVMTNDFTSSGGSHLIATPTGNLIQTNPNDTIVGSTRVNDFASGPAGSMPIGNNDKPIKVDNSELIRQNKEMKNEMIQLRRDMASYFGFGGTANKSIGNAVGNRLANELG